MACRANIPTTASLLNAIYIKASQWVSTLKMHILSARGCAMYILLISSRPLLWNLPNLPRTVGWAETSCGNCGKFKILSELSFRIGSWQPNFIALVRGWYLVLPSSISIGFIWRWRIYNYFVIDDTGLRNSRINIQFKGTVSWKLRWALL
jgi:hypothetical protein